MASSSSKAPCATCDNKAAGIFRCEGCLHVFCRKHLNEHRDVLSHQLDEIVLEHDTLQQTIVENKSKPNKQHPALEEIDQWEQDSIVKIQQIAEEARSQVKKLISSQTVSKELHDLAERLQTARMDDDYVETDLRTWITMLQKLKDDLSTHSPSLIVQEDLTQTVVGYMRVSTTSTQLSRQTERFGEFCGNVRIDTGGYLATHCGLNDGPALVRGVSEYSTGKHKVRFLFKKSSLKYATCFVVTSKTIPKDGETFRYSGYGWFSNDDISHPNATRAVDKNFQDMNGQTTFEIELELDCSRGKISYVNQGTKNRREMYVALRKCPLPWQVRFFMYEVGDCVRLLT